MNFHGCFSENKLQPIRQSSLSRPINAQKKSYKIKIIDYTTRIVSRWKEPKKSYENSLLAHFLNIKFLLSLFRCVEALQARVDGGIETFLVGLERRVNDIYVNVMSYTKACGKVATSSREAHRGSLKNFFKNFSLMT